MDKVKLKRTFKLTMFLMLVSLIILTGLFFLFSLIILFSNFSPLLVDKLTNIVSGFGIFLATYITSRIVNKRGLILGLICGGTISIIVFAVTALSTGVIFSISEFIKIVLIMISACLGGVLGSNSRKN